jgi:hypothetical protein
MRYAKLIAIFSFLVIINGCANTQRIIRRDYNYEKLFFGTHRVEFVISLENIGNSDEISNLVETLIYDNKNFDAYLEFIENEFIGDAREDFYPQIFNDDGTEYFYKSYLCKEYSVEHYSGLFVIIRYFNYFYYSGAAHGNYWIEYYIVDLSEKRLLNIADLVNPIPDDLLRELIESNNGITLGDYSRENIFPPDTINFCNDNIELIWNTYQIVPYVVGIIGVEIQDDVIQEYLTDKGKEIRNANVYNPSR